MTRTRKAISVTSAVMAVLFTLLLVCSMPLPASAEALTGKTAMELMTELDLGWNLGNTLDATGGNGTLESETSWGNPKTTKAMIDAVKAQGFNTMRLPVSWGSHMTNSASGYVIDSQWMARVKTIVDYAIDNGMYVILNIHHDNDIRSGDDCFFYPSETYKDQSIKFVKAVWTQISETFKDYDQHLIFETLNEPRLVGTGDEWWFPVNNPGASVAEAISIINQMNQAAVDVIRTSGGNNADRCIMIPGYGASIDGCTTPNYTLPTDTAQNRLIVSVHAYTPYNFALNASGTSVFSDDLKSEVDYLFNTLKSSFLDKNIPVVIGEASASNKNNASERLKWANYYMGKSSALNIPVMLWDNNVYSGSSNLGEQHGYLNRLTLTWNDKDVVDAMVACYGNTPSGDNGNGDDDDDDDNNVTTDSTVLFTGSASASKWAQATSVMTIKNDGGTLNPAIITEDGYFYVEYTGDIGKIELIMQSWSGGTEWAKICLSESGMAGSNYYAKFSYADCVAAFGEDFATYLDCVYIGATDGSITALSLSYVTEKAAEEPAVPEEPALPSAMTGFALKSRNYNSITLTWDKNDSADGYIIQQMKNDVWTNVTNIKDNTVTNYQITGLAANTSYKFRMVAYVTANDTNYYGSFTSATAISTAPAQTQGFAITGRGSDYLTITWTKNAGASGYIIQEQIDGVWTNVTNIRNGATVSYKITGLEANSFHRYRMVAYKVDANGTCYGKYTGSAPAYTAPAMVSGLKISSSQPDALTVSWNKTSSANGYVLDIYKDGKWTQLAKITSNATTSYKATGLTLGTTYKFRIKSYATNGSLTIYSTYSSAIAGIPAPEKVANLRMTNRGTDFISVRWDKNDDADGYMVYIYDGTGWKCVKTLTSPNAVSHKITELESGKAYKVTVKAYKTVNNVKVVSDSSTISADTL